MSIDPRFTNIKPLIVEDVTKFNNHPELAYERPMIFYIRRYYEEMMPDQTPEIVDTLVEKYFEDWVKRESSFK